MRRFTTRKAESKVYQYRFICEPEGHDWTGWYENKRPLGRRLFSYCPGCGKKVWIWAEQEEGRTLGRRQTILYNQKERR